MPESTLGDAGGNDRGTDDEIRELRAQVRDLASELFGEEAVWDPDVKRWESLS